MQYVGKRQAHSSQSSVPVAAWMRWGAVGLGGAGFGCVGVWVCGLEWGS